MSVLPVLVRWASPLPAASGAATGFSGGVLACGVDCTSFDTSGCVP